MLPIFQPTTPFRKDFEFIINSKVTFKSILGPDDTWQDLQAWIG